MSSYEHTHKMKDVATPNEMRVELHKAANHFATIRRCFDVAQYNGWSGEDKYTFLAYHTFKQNQELNDRLLKLMEYAT